jgi:hypothetical protein
MFGPEHDVSKVDEGKLLFEKKEGFVSDLFLQPGEGKLCRNFINIIRPLAEIEWAKMTKIIRKVDAIASVQILPPRTRGYLPLSNGVINIFVRRFMKHACRSIGLANILQAQGESDLLEMENYWLGLRGTGTRLALEGGEAETFQELPYRHLIAYLPVQDTDPKAYLALANSMCAHLVEQEAEGQEIGLNLLVNKHLLLAVPLLRPFAVFNGQPIFLHESSLLGLLSIPKLKTNWENRELNKERDPEECLACMSPP